MPNASDGVSEQKVPTSLARGGLMTSPQWVLDVSTFAFRPVFSLRGTPTWPSVLRPMAAVLLRLLRSG